MIPLQILFPGVFEQIHQDHSPTAESSQLTKIKIFDILKLELMIDKSQYDCANISIMRASRSLRNF